MVGAAAGAGAAGGLTAASGCGALRSAAGAARPWPGSRIGSLVITPGTGARAGTDAAPGAPWDGSGDGGWLSPLLCEGGWLSPPWPRSWDEAACGVGGLGSSGTGEVESRSYLGGISAVSRFSGTGEGGCGGCGCCGGGCGGGGCSFCSESPLLPPPTCGGGGGGDGGAT